MGTESGSIRRMRKLSRSIRRKHVDESTAAVAPDGSDSSTANSFHRVELSVAELLILLGSDLPRKQLIERLRQQSGVVAADLNSVTRRSPETVDAAPISEDDFISEVR